MFDEALLARVEDASLNASAPPQQRWIDGWLVRYSPGKARRARCVNAVAAGRLPLDERLRLAARVYADAGLPMHVRITPFTQPPTLDGELAARGWMAIENTPVMVRPHLDGLGATGPLPAGLHWVELAADRFAATVGALRGSSVAEQRAHAERLRWSPTPYRGFALLDDANEPVCCGQFAREADWVGLYDVFTAPGRRREGMARLICERLLIKAAQDGACAAYLQVGSENLGARRVYERLGFAEAYAYHYRVAPGVV